MAALSSADAKQKPILTSPGALTKSELWGLASRMWKGLPTRGHRRGLSRTLHKNTFEGHDAVQWILTHLGIEDTLDNRMIGAGYGQQMVVAGYITRTTVNAGLKTWMGRQKRHSSVFEDSSELYRFNPVAVSLTHLSVAVFRASGLLGKNNSACDPVCYVKLGKTQEFHTKVMQNTMDPAWNEMFTFGVRSVESEQLEVNVYDCNAMGGLFFLGCVHLPLTAIETVIQNGIHSKHVSVKTATKVDGSRARAVTAIHNGVGGQNTGMHVGISNALNFIAGKNFFTEQTTKVYKLQRGVVGKSTSHKIKGEIELGLVIETTDENVLLTANGGSGSFEKQEGQAEIMNFRVNVDICRVRNSREVGIMKLGNVTPILRWLNRIEIRINGKKRHTSYVPKKTGPTFNELLSIDLSKEEMKTAKVITLILSQCGQLKDHGTVVGEVSVPLRLCNHNGSIPAVMWHPLVFYGSDNLPKENGEVQMSCWIEECEHRNVLGEELESDAIILEGIPGPTGDVIPPLQHVLVERILSAPHAFLSRGIWESDEFMKTFYKSHKYVDVQIGEWNNPPQDQGSDQELPRFRESTYTIPPNMFVGMLQGHRTDTIVDSSCLRTVVKSVSRTPSAPYGEMFDVWTQFVLEWVGRRETKLTISFETHWVADKPWVAGQIEGKVSEGTTETVGIFVDLLEANLGTKKSPRISEHSVDSRTQKRWVALQALLLLLCIVLAGAHMFLNFEAQQTSEVDAAEQVHTGL
jgi:hypothetical protein